MKIEQVKKPKKTKGKIMSIRVSEDASKWMKKNDISPQKVFNIALEELIKENK